MRRRSALYRVYGRPRRHEVEHAQVVSREEMLAALEQRYGHIAPGREQVSRFRHAPAERFRARPMAPFLALSPLPPRRFAGTAIAAGSPPTACGIAASMPRAAPISGGFCGMAHRARKLRLRFRAPGHSARIAARKSARRSQSAGRWFRSSNCGRIRTSRCTRAAASIA